PYTTLFRSAFLFEGSLRVSYQITFTDPSDWSTARRGMKWSWRPGVLPVASSTCFGAPQVFPPSFDAWRKTWNPLALSPSMYAQYTVPLFGPPERSTSIDGK